MRKLCLKIEYDGSAYKGWQVQVDGPTIQGVIQEKLRTMTGEENVVVGAGRTDAGVHAWGQVAHFVTQTQIPISGFSKGLNSLLPPDIRILEAHDVPIDFHAQRRAKSKVYKYLILNQEAPSAIYSNYAWHIPRPLNLELMRQACTGLLGRQNFSSFQAADPKDTEPTRTIFRSEVKGMGFNGKSFVEFTFEADGFLKHMIRNIVGTIAQVGSGKIELEQFDQIISAHDRTQAGPTSPPCGLYLVEVKY